MWKAGQGMEVFLRSLLSEATDAQMSSMQMKTGPEGM